MLKAKISFLCLVFMFGRSAIIRSGFLFYLLTYRILDHNFQFSIFNFQLKYASSKSFATCIEYLPFAPCSITTAIATSGFSYGA